MSNVMTALIANPGTHQQEPDVTIVVVNYNAGDLLKKCIEQAVKQAFEVIVVDNASRDGSLDNLSEFSLADTRLSIVRGSRNVGFAAACNIGAARATGRYLLFLNPDCLLETGAVTELKAALESHSRIGMVGGLLLNEDGTEQAGGRRAVPTPWRSLVRTFHLSRFADRWPKLFADFNLHQQPLPEQPIELEAISGACMMVKREAMEGVGPWDESYFLHCEDLDLCMRYRQNDWSILFVPSARMVHLRGACSSTRPVFVEWHKHQGMMRFYRKFFRRQYPGVLMWAVWLGIWMRFIAVAIYVMCQKILANIAGTKRHV